MTSPYNGNGCGYDGCGYGIGVPMPSTTAPLLLDELPQFRIAVATKKLRTAYSGDCFQVRRSSDSSTANYGFVDGVVDSASYDTFCGAGNGFVAAWYDQSGSGNDLTMATTTRQPRVVNSGIVDNVSTIPSVRFVAASGHWLDSPTLTYSRPYHRFMVLKLAATSTTYFLWDGQANNVGSLSYTSSVKRFEAYGGASLLRTEASHPTLFIVDCLFDGATSYLRINNATETTGSTGTGTLPTKLRLGASGGGVLPLDADVLAFLDYNGELTTEQATAVRDGLNELYGVF